MLWIMQRLSLDLPWDREFSLCEPTGYKIENDCKFFSNTLKVQKALRNMHRALAKSDLYLVECFKSWSCVFARSFLCPNSYHIAFLTVSFLLSTWKVGSIHRSRSLLHLVSTRWSLTLRIHAIGKP